MLKSDPEILVEITFTNVGIFMINKTDHNGDECFEYGNDLF